MAWRVLATRVSDAENRVCIGAINRETAAVNGDHCRDVRQGSRQCDRPICRPRLRDVYGVLKSCAASYAAGLGAAIVGCGDGLAQGAVGIDVDVGRQGRRRRQKKQQNDKRRLQD